MYFVNITSCAEPLTSVYLIAVTYIGPPSTHTQFSSAHRRMFQQDDNVFLQHITVQALNNDNLVLFCTTSSYKLILVFSLVCFRCSQTKQIAWDCPGLTLPLPYESWDRIQQTIGKWKMDGWINKGFRVSERLI